MSITIHSMISLGKIVWKTTWSMFLTYPSDKSKLLQLKEKTTLPYRKFFGLEVTWALESYKLTKFTMTNKRKEVTAASLPVELAQPKNREIIFRKNRNNLRIYGAVETFYSINTGITGISIILLHNSVFPMNSFNRFIFDNTTWGQVFNEWFE